MSKPLVTEYLEEFDRLQEIKGELRKRNKRIEELEQTLILCRDSKNNLGDRFDALSDRCADLEAALRRIETSSQLVMGHFVATAAGHSSCMEIARRALEGDSA